MDVPKRTRPNHAQFVQLVIERQSESGVKAEFFPAELILVRDCSHRDQW